MLEVLKKEVRYERRSNILDRYGLRGDGLSDSCTTLAIPDAQTLIMQVHMEPCQQSPPVQCPRFMVLSQGQGIRAANQDPRVNDNSQATIRRNIRRSMT